MNETDENDERVEQQRLIAETAAAFARRELAPAHLRSEAMSRSRWRGLAEIGMTSILLPQDVGGLGLKIGDMAPVLEELGKPLLREPVVAAGVLPGLALAGIEKSSLKAQLMKRLMGGELVAAVAWQETNEPLCGEHLDTSIRTLKDGLCLSGQKVHVIPGSDVDGFIVSARSEGGVALLWVDAAAPGVCIEQLCLADGGASATIRFDGVRLTAESLLCQEGSDLLRRSIDAATICISAELLGLIRGANEMTLAYLRTRKQFERAIGSFQALQHRAADLYIQQELCAAAVLRAVRDFEDASTPEDSAVAASRAKARCSAVALFVTKEAVQMHGGIGYTDEHDIGLYLKRALTLSAWLGNAAEHRNRFGNLTMKAPS